jgi:OTU domain-containing protein 3
VCLCAHTSRAVADQLYGNEHLHAEVRAAAVDAMEAEPDEFAPFVEDDKTFDAYLSDMRSDAVWGGHMELQGLSRAFAVNLVVHQLGSQPWEIRNFPPTARTLHLSYHDGEHYSSVRYALRAQHN